MNDFGDIKGVTMPAWAIARATGRRGTAHCFAVLDPARTALVVIDLQLGYMHPSGGYLDCPAARDIVPTVNRMARGLRGGGGLVVWIRNTHDESCLRDWTVQQTMNSPEANARRNAALSPGGPGHPLWPGLETHPDDLVLDKRRYSAFIPGTCDLAPALRTRGVDTVLIAGTLTNVCCDSSARDSMMLDFRTVMLADACASTSAEEHDAALAAFYATFGDVQDVDFALAALARPRSSAAA